MCRIIDGCRCRAAARNAAKGDRVQVRRIAVNDGQTKGLAHVFGN